MLCNFRRADTAVAETETAVSSAAGSQAESVLPTATTDTADQQDGVRETAVSMPVTTHSALLGVRNAIDASYVSCQRHLSRRVCQPFLYIILYFVGSIGCQSGNT